MKYTIDKEFPPKHTLTPDEEAFLSALARYTLFLDKSLFFQIDNLQRHTELVLSGEKYEHQAIPSKDKIEREIAELEKMIKELWDNLQEQIENTLDSVTLLDLMNSYNDKICFSYTI